MTKNEAIRALIDALAGDDADDVKIAGDTTADSIAYLATCLSVDGGAVKFAIPEEG